LGGCYSFAWSTTKILILLWFDYCGAAMPYCVKCGNKLKVDDQFYPVCGATVPYFTSQEYIVNGNEVIDRVKQLLHEAM